ncbi:unnamed protein product [Spirodela intermedia]|uniref:Glutamate receptor n=1 Tax=Spirodela intermedia TaxID=51605 RepID=A0A7I8IK75_SPIIN|nr:unnamed protein product [Spirodela intermedia]CAA6658251.1 unnamed protein product [Spirodela intermedia]
MHSVLLLVLLSQLSLNSLLVYCERPRAVNVGVVLTQDSVIGGVAKVAIEVAVGDINANPSILVGTQLKLILENSNCSSFLGSIAVSLRVLEKDAVVIIGPQSSTVAHSISFVANGLRIPLLSFAATDPTLSSLQWKEVIAVFVGDDYGWNGVSSLSDALAKKMSKVVHKVALPVGASSNVISELLNMSKVVGPRVYVVHASPDSGLLIFSVAQKLQMMTDEFVWFATDWLSTSLDSAAEIGDNLVNLTGVIFFRQYIPPSSTKKAFVLRWNELLRKGRVRYRLNTHGFLAYDTVWAVALGINELLSESNNISFSYSKNLQDVKGKLQLGNLKTFDHGQLLLEKLLLLNFTGISGLVQFDSERNLIRGVYEVLNVDNYVIRSVGYWSTHSGLSVLVPTIIYSNAPSNFTENQELGNVVWPGGKTVKPRGYVLASHERPFKVGFPRRVSFTEFSKEIEGTLEVEGYCVDVFKAALKLVPYDVPYQFVPFGDGESSPSYDELVNMVVENVINAAMGDISITTNRTRLVDFTQPYISTGLVVICKVENTKVSSWTFLRPFTTKMWCVLGAFFVIIGFVIWILEHRVNSDFRGPLRRQCMTSLLFSFSTLFHSQQEDTVSTPGRVVMMIWFFLLMVITSSYTASLTSFLTVQQLSSPITGIDSLIASNQPIGYQMGSFSYSYLTSNLNVHRSRLVSLGSQEAYEAALDLGPKNGGVAAIVDELPYVEHFLARTTGYGIVGSSFTKGGWGFRESSGIDMSTAILQLSESGELQRIHDKWLCVEGCPSHRGDDPNPNHLHLNSFWGLFLVCGMITLSALLIFAIKTIWQFICYERNRDAAAGAEGSSGRSCSAVAWSFLDFVDKKEGAIRHLFSRPESPSQPHVN